ncbi:MAG: ATP-binding cassette domain-containing protein [Saccharospirillaceae bacterium]|nr:ATP-binding cassette domain-containing protein [Pseudomonadales bacterium]NRB80102.1 ATP-binding cassette domain-containing protein [Saccharospirillaceae bacterium]
MPLISFQDVSIAFGQHDLMHEVNWNIERGQRVCVIGRNGAGKSTMLKIVQGEHIPDSGVVRKDSTLKIGYLPQELPDRVDMTVQDVISEGVKEVIDALEKYNEISISADPDMDKLTDLQNIIEANDGWDVENRIKQILQRLELTADQSLSDLSGGWRRRVLLGKALVQSPDVLLLDEPTNHLDIEMVNWLEDFLTSFKGAVLFISHDRAFVDAVATDLLEIDRGKFLSFKGSYELFVEYKEKCLADEEAQWALFDKKLAAEEVWVRQGIKARRTRNEGRVRALKDLRSERGARLNGQGSVNFDVSTGSKSGKVVFEAKNASVGFDGKTIVKDFTCLVRRGDKIGFIGPNGIGKTTLIKMLLGQLEPSSGSVKTGTTLQVGYFDQQRKALDMDKTVQDFVSEGSDFIEINGRRRHVISYLEYFLFSPERCRQPVSVLSGGEANRLVLARLFSQPVNLLVMDEPTNDLDMDTLELLETLLLQFEGTLLLVSHDRTFIDNVVTDVWAFEGEGQVNHYVGGFKDWKRQGGVWPNVFNKKQNAPKQSSGLSSAPVENTLKEDETVTSKPKKKLSYKIQREFDELPDKMAKIEHKIEVLTAQTAEADFYTKSADVTTGVLNEISQTQESLDLLLDRWVEIEELMS